MKPTVLLQPRLRAGAFVVGVFLFICLLLWSLNVPTSDVTKPLVGTTTTTHSGIVVESITVAPTP